MHFKIKLSGGYFDASLQEKVTSFNIRTTKSCFDPWSQLILTSGKK